MTEEEYPFCQDPRMVELERRESLKKNLKPYMGYSKEAGSENGACLVFAHTKTEAKKLAFTILKNWDDAQEWIDVKVKWLKDEDYLYDQANQEKLRNGIAHVIESPTCCDSCNLWGKELDEKGLCEDCREEDND